MDLRTINSIDSLLNQKTMDAHSYYLNMKKELLEKYNTTWLNSNCMSASEREHFEVAEQDYIYWMKIYEDFQKHQW